MKYRVLVTPLARGDIDRNANWWADHHSVEQALRWSDAIYDQLASLRDFPESYPVSIENSEFEHEIREKLVGLGPRPSYRAIYTIRGDEVLVLTIRAGEQDRMTPADVDFADSI